MAQGPVSRRVKGYPQDKAVETSRFGKDFQSP